MNVKLIRQTLNQLLTHQITIHKHSRKLVKEAGQKGLSQHVMVIGKRAGAALISSIGISSIGISSIGISSVGKVMTPLDMRQNRCVMNRCMIWHG